LPDSQEIRNRGSEAQRAFIRVPDAARQLGVTERQVYRYVQQKRVPFYKERKLLFFRPSELDAWMCEFRVGPEP
jgi:excisionase family DNA binding protein